MPRLPAFCEACGAVFASPLRAAAPGRENAFGIPVPCPACGGTGRVPAELLVIAAEAAGLFAAEAAGPEEADAFLELISELSAGEEGPGQELVVETARRAPIFVDLARRLPAARPRVLAGVGRLLRRVRASVAGGGGPSVDGHGREPAGGEPGSDDATDAALEAAAVEAVEALLEEEGVEAADDSVPEDVERARRRLETAGRNDPCPCGSGEKYKACHWVADLRTTRS